MISSAISITFYTAKRGTPKMQLVGNLTAMISATLAATQAYVIDAVFGLLQWAILTAWR
jgi:hypothetical protein